MDRMLILNPETREKISALKEHAEANIVPFSVMKERAEAYAKGSDHPGDGYNDEFTIEIPECYRVTYTQEEHPMGLCHHISVSIPDKGKHPSMNAFAALCMAFGFYYDPSNETTWPEVLPSGRVAINHVCKVEEKATSIN